MMRKQMGLIIPITHGDRGYNVTALLHNEPHIRFDTVAGLETFCGTLGGYLEGKISKAQASCGAWYNPDLIRSNDNGTAVTKIYTVKFVGYPMSKKVDVGFINPLKVKEVGSLLKAQEWYAPNGTKLVAKSVTVSM